VRVRVRALLTSAAITACAGALSVAACSLPYRSEGGTPGDVDTTRDTTSVTFDDAGVRAVSTSDDDAGEPDATPDKAPTPPCNPGERAQQTRSPASVVTVTSLQNVNGGTISSQGIPWTTPENARTSDDTAATVALAAPTRASNYMVLTNFGFAIPEGATIDGVGYEVERRADELASVTDLDVRPLVLGRAVLSVQLASNEPWGNFDGAAKYGGLGANFGVSWTPARINDVGFGMSFRAWSIVDAGAPTARVDAVKATVFYTCP
jgi:hypothetical protein